ncbi:tRNA (cytosine(72)-C(5))-methyltransferase NSUN6 isoform X2 [Centruroides vittatus]|uniref:tRNA (cytosine(72)-C(5))-methyltransferase NSUN6 isoform X2 n=1 Tax=Centruroides vittatus TaxID=120091 RepID=UPI00350ED074
MNPEQMVINSPFEKNPKLKEQLMQDLLKAKDNEEETPLFLFEQLEKWLTSPPAYTTVRVNTVLIDVDTALEKLKAILVQQCVNRQLPMPSIFVHPSLPDLLVINCPPVTNQKEPSKHEVIVGCECGMSVLRGADVYAPGVIACPHGLKVGDKVAIYADIDNTCRRGFVKPFLGRKKFVGNGVLVVNRQQIFCVEKPYGLAIKIDEPLYNCWSFKDILPEDLFLQNLPSVLCSHVLAPKPGDYVLDMCAAPGGKTTHIGILMKNKGHVIALDKSSSKIQKVIKNVNLCKLSCVTGFVFDSTKAVDNTKTAEDGENIRKSESISPPPFPIELFDCILLDAPCSALGQRPQLSNLMTPKELNSYPPLQKKLFNVGEKLLRKGGVLVYSTCTLTVSENESIVQWALDSFSNLSLVSQLDT